MGSENEKAKNVNNISSKYIITYIIYFIDAAKIRRKS